MQALYTPESAQHDLAHDKTQAIRALNAETQQSTFIPSPNSMAPEHPPRLLPPTGSSAPIPPTCSTKPMEFSRSGPVRCCCHLVTVQGSLNMGLRGRKNGFSIVCVPSAIVGLNEVGRTSTPTVLLDAVLPRLPSSPTHCWGHTQLPPVLDPSAFQPPA